ncbi:MAG: metallophosphatase family protein [Bacteroidetes bacterium]|nr:metallophosphatase family protein [Bacteroidota bacterium]
MERFLYYIKREGLVVQIAILSDIHSNLEALEAVLRSLKRYKPDTIVCLGDVVGYGANPNECVDLIRQHCHLVLQGNHDAALLDQQLKYYFTEHARIAIEWTLEQISTPRLDYLRSLQLTARMENLLFVHSAPTDPKRWEYIVDEYDAIKHFSSFQERLCFVGHSHIPGIYSEEGRKPLIDAQRRFIINVGSVGQPRDGDSRACYALFNTKTTMYECIRVEYKVELTVKKILDAGLPSHLGYRLYNGV